MRDKNTSARLCAKMQGELMREGGGGGGISGTLRYLFKPSSPVPQERVA